MTRTVAYYPTTGAIQLDGTLYYILKDHLGSASVVTDSAGTDVGGQRYYPFGETRFTTGTMYTDKLFTGQREMMGLGIYHYGARFFSPKLGRFLSPDTIVPGYANPQALNRYSYVLNNPLRYTDPSGHRPCEDGDCQINPLAYRITYDFGWILKGDDWTSKELQTIFVTGNKIKKYVDNITNEKGQEWMDKYMSDISISIGNKDRGSSIPGSISLPNWWDGGDNFDKYYLAHELAHTWDSKTGHIGMVGIVEGTADYLNDFIDGDVLGSWSCRFCDNTGEKHIPDAYQFTKPVGNIYGNNSTADYLADSFAYSVYSAEYPGYVPSSNVTLWINTVISLQASYLP